MDGRVTAQAYAEVRAPYPFRRHQGLALEALAEVREERERAWVVLPPGAGKTLVGLETIRREGVRRAGSRALVLCPNTAIQGQWVRGWKSFVGPDSSRSIPVGTTRDLTAPVTVLTYQSLAVFAEEDGDPAVEGDSPDTSTVIDRLHPNGQALVAALRAAGPLTLVLDECHHLLEVWGRLLAELLDLLPEAYVLGLTATPPEVLDRDQSALIDGLFGEIVHATSVPAVVREGHLAPFLDLIWLTTPDPVEADWLDAQGERFRELTTAVLDPTLGSTPFLTWLDQRFAGEIPFARVAARHPDLGDAALRMRHTGLLRLSPDVVSGEQHDRAPSADDWVLLLDDWYDHVLRESTDPSDTDVVEKLRRALPSVGYQLTRRGLRRGRSNVDRVLARSASKSEALVAIVAAEHRTLGDRLAMLVICDHENAGATTSADLDGVLVDRAGSARLALATLLADPATRDLAPLMVTGRTVAAAPATLEKVRSAAGRSDLVVSRPDTDGIAELTGPWTSRDWVRVATEHFSARASRVLIGTRALLGEGWDAPAATGLVDLSTATTTAAVVQTRGRTLRLDPGHPGKVAVNWTVTCVTADHPQGDNDWRRTVRKHRGYFGVDRTGDVVDGVAHVHPSFSPYHPPSVAGFDEINAAMLVAAENRSGVREAWRIGQPYLDQVRQALWVRPSGPPSPADSTLPSVLTSALPAPAPPAVRLTESGPRWSGRLDVWRGWPGAAAGLAGGLAIVVGAALMVGAVPLGVAIAAVAAGSTVVAARGAAGRRRVVLSELADGPDLLALAGAVADGLHASGVTSVGAEAVTWRPSRDGEIRVVLEAASREESEAFAVALAELIDPVRDPRYLVPRPVLTFPGADDATTPSAYLPLTRVRPAGVVWHPVPTVLGVNARRAQRFATAWHAWVGGGAAVYTRTPEGAGILAAARGTAPLASGSVLRLDWS